MRRTKIVATLGPACAQEGVLGRMVQAGVDLFRINTSHGTPAEHEAYIRLVRDLARGLERPLGVVLDTQGPKVRVGELREPLEIREGEEVLLGEKGIPLSHVEAVTTARPGERVLIDDGRLSLEIVAVEGKALRCWVLR
ncbi:pyruvate kinase, partial [Candidatus Bipolaricaulota bacterium]|nr:pyruvate kinase [Candidatus Bipolaricaulota bacterium]